MIEPKLIAVLHAIAGAANVYPDVALPGAQAPWITYQQIGGKSPTSLDQKLIDKRNGVFQISVWAKTRPEATRIALQIEDALSLSALQVIPMGAMRSDYELDTKLFGSRQDFSIWDDRL
ncbi:hypothetical protein HNP33_003707 [Comamonas odontotermitis]|uniref:DUF3168 domain-containing protein n=1 Tax=Comamonas odontotermitis TaxID=379895 RepID=A0ABR6RK83_9BURK|nr:DUF3168 domain-containing protein [Comamonas odontotermitis]MBB6579593.1 hypothetical protein [Comamonas odontotermitis]